MTYKNLRYSHKCFPEPPPVKKQAKPKAKQQPKPKISTQTIYEEEEEEHEVSCSIRDQPQQVEFKLIKPEREASHTRPTTS